MMINRHSRSLSGCREEDSPGRITSRLVFIAVRKIYRGIHGKSYRLVTADVRASVTTSPFPIDLLTGR